MPEGLCESELPSMNLDRIVEIVDDLPLAIPEFSATKSCGAPLPIDGGCLGEGPGSLAEGGVCE
jgi:hypothetical protein